MPVFLGMSSLSQCEQFLTVQPASSPPMTSSKKVKKKIVRKIKSSFMIRDSVTASTKKEAVTSHPFGDIILEGAIDKYGRSRIHQNITKAVALTDREAGIISHLSSASIFSKTYLKFFVD